MIDPEKNPDYYTKVSKGLWAYVLLMISAMLFVGALILAWL
jgi:hypothetical protein